LISLAGSASARAAGTSATQHPAVAGSGPTPTYAQLLVEADQLAAEWLGPRGLSATRPASVSQSATPVTKSKPSPTKPAPTTAAPTKSAPAKVVPVHSRSTPAASHGIPSWLVISAVAILLALAVTLLVGTLRDDGAARARVAEGLGVGEPETALPALATETPEVLSGQRWWPAFVERVEVGRFDHSPVQLVEFAALAGVVGAVVVMVALGSTVLGLMCIPLALFVLWFLVKRGARKQRQKFSQQLMTQMLDIAGALRAGRSFSGAITAVAGGAQEPMRSELERALEEERLGKPLEDTLRDISVRMESIDMAQVALIAELNSMSGSNVAESLTRVAEGATDRHDLRRELEALTGQARLSSRVIAALPIFVGIAMIVIAPGFAHPLLHTTAGIIVLGLCGVMILIGFTIMKRIVNVEA
jgi:Flp pilus assembly protein TadB